MQLVFRTNEEMTVCDCVCKGYEIHGFEKIPSSGPALIVYYHGALPTDFYYLMANTILRKKRQIRAVGDRFLFHIPGNL